MQTIQSPPAGIQELNDVRSIDPNVSGIYTVFGPETVLVPLIGESPSPGWDTLSVAKTLDASHQRLLHQHRVAVVLSASAGNLYAVHFTNKERYDQCALIAPWLRTTLVTQHKGALYAFFRLTEPFRHTFPFEHGTFVGRDSWIPLGKEGGVHVPQPVITLDLSDLLFTPNLRVALMPPILQKELGSAFVETKRGKQLKPQYWATYFARSQLVTFGSFRGFRMSTEDEKHVSLSREQLETVFIVFLQTLAKTQPNLQPFIEPRSIKRVLDVLSTVARQIENTDRDTIQLLYDEHIMQIPGADVTTAELYAVYVEMCARQQFPLLSRSQFGSRLKVFLAAQGFPESKSITRQGRQTRGYRGLKLSEGTVGTVGADGALGAAIVQNFF